MAKKEPKPLTNRQQSVFDLLRSGLTPNEVAERLKTSSTNIYGHMRKIKDKGHRIPRATGRTARSTARSMGRKRGATAPADGKPNGAVKMDGAPDHVKDAIAAVKHAIEIEAMEAQKHQDRLSTLRDELTAEEQRAELTVAEMERLQKAEKDLVGT